MTREEGLKQIEETQWTKDADHDLLDLWVSDPHGCAVHAWLLMRPVYCDRGHIQLNIEGPLDLDRQDSFPRFFFSFEEADRHTRTFLKWRMWKERGAAYDEIRSTFEAQGTGPTVLAGPSGATPASS
jgi:hypothetical protein